MVHRVSVTVGESEFVLETGLLANLAAGAVTVRSGDTLLLATATASEEPREGADFFPLTVDYEEKLYAAGKIPGSFFRREGKPSESAILTARLTDRPLRPLFPKGFRNDVQIVVTALSTDQEHYLDIAAIIGASASLTLSELPFLGPVGAVRVGLIDGKLVYNPTASQMGNSKLDLRLAGTADAILMVEAGADEIPEDLMVEALASGHAAMQPIIQAQNQLREMAGKPKREFPLSVPGDDIKQAVAEVVGNQITELLTHGLMKQERNEAVDKLRNEIKQQLAEKFDPVMAATAFEAQLKSTVRHEILHNNRRPDGRDRTTIRPISCAVGLLPRAHGSGLFTRGETQVLTVATLGTPDEQQTIDTLSPDDTKRYMHHYNMPPYATGEAKPLRSTGRREIGHGALAERALAPMIPPTDQFPYTLRLVSETLASNGSSSMASVCGSTLALMDAGVPIKAPVAGVAMGLITEGDQFAVLTDIIGMEDALGDMDFKVAGTRNGITALQMDIKIKGLNMDILRQALQQAHEGRLFIMDKMLAVMPTPRPDVSPYAPRITKITINPEKIGAVIGPGGKMIRKIQDETGAKIDIEDDGSVFISAADGPAAQAAISQVRALTEEVELGQIYTGTVVRTTDFGAFVEILPGKDGLVHISQLADYRAPTVEDVVQVGDEVTVMVIGIDPSGKVKLSRQAVLEGWTLEEAQAKDQRSRPRGSSEGGSERRGGFGGGDRDRGGERRGGGFSSGRSGYGDRGSERGGDRGPRR